MTRQLEISTLEGAAEHYAAFFLLPDRRNESDTRWLAGPSYVLQDFERFDFMDEFNALRDLIEPHMGAATLAKFQDRLAKLPKRDKKTLEKMLADRLAITPDGDHIEGKIGTTSLGTRIIGYTGKVVETKSGPIVFPKKLAWQIYAGEEDERARPGGGVADPLPQYGDPRNLMMANAPCFSAELSIAMLDQVTARLDEGTAAAEIRGRTGAKPADPDAAETGTLLFTCVMTDPAFPAAVDDADGTVSVTASAISDDASADATGTLAYCRVGATGTGVDDHIDGEAGTSASDFNFNTLSIVSGSTVSITSFVVNLSQGGTAS